MNSPSQLPEQVNITKTAEVQREVNDIILHIETVKTNYALSYANRNKGDKYGVEVFDDPYLIEVEHQIETQRFVGRTTPPEICTVLEVLIEMLRKEAPSYKEKSQIASFFLGFLNYNWSEARTPGLKFAIPVVDNILKEIGW